MLQSAGELSVLGDFTETELVLHGARYGLRRTDGAYFITTPGASGQPQEFEVDYTLGSRRIQHYLTELDDGRIVVLAPSWDVKREVWFHNMDIVDPEESSTAQTQVWNKNCYSCHVSREVKGFDPIRNVYETSWQDFGTNCERCHGLGGDHAAARRSNAPNPPAMVVPSRLAPDRASMVCAQCHSAREIVAEGFNAGDDYFNYYLPVLEFGQKVSNDPAYWPDGRTRRFSNDALGLWQSQCFLQGGATCVSCHTNLHNPQVENNPSLQPGVNAICTNCHQEIGRNVEKHSRHPAGSEGAACVNCHMPRTVFSVKAEIRDHSMSIPVPENTANYGIPNACNQCHEDRDPKWAETAMDKWWGTKSRAKLRDRAAAFSAARAGNPSAIPDLLKILSDTSQGAVIRANSVGHLSRFREDRRTIPALLNAMSDAEPLVRAVAAQRMPVRNLTPDVAERVASALRRGLEDPIRSVRVSAVLSLADSGVVPSGPLLERAKQEYLDRTSIHIDFPEEQLNAGKFALLLNDPEAAIRALETTMQQSANTEALYPLALAYLMEGRTTEGLRLLRTIPDDDPSYSAARNLITSIEGK